MHDNDKTNGCYRLNVLRRLALLCGILSAYSLVGGCSVVDDLRVHNNLAYPITLTRQFKNWDNITVQVRLGPILPHTTAEYMGEAERNGSAIEELHVLGPSGKDSGLLDSVAKHITSEPRNGCSGGTTWDVTLGKPDEAAAATAQQTKGSGCGMLYLGLLIFAVPCAIAAVSVVSTTLKRYWRRSGIYGRQPEVPAANPAAGDYDLN